MRAPQKWHGQMGGVHLSRGACGTSESHVLRWARAFDPYFLYYMYKPPVHKITTLQ